MASATDNFNRADGGVGANWSNLLNSLDVSSNRVKGHTATNDNIARWAANTFSNDQSSQTTWGLDNDGGGPMVRLQNAAASGVLAYSNAALTIQYYLVSAGSFTLKVDTGWSGSANMAVNDTFKLAVASQTYTASRNGTNANATWTDGSSTYTSGWPGIHIYDTANAQDDWVGDPTAGAYTITAGAGSYNFTGTAATPKHAWKPTAAAGSYTMTGTNAATTHQWKIGAGAGSYLLTGTAATPLHAWIASAGAGSYLMTGTAASPKAGKITTAGAGSYSMTGVNATFVKSWTVSAGAGSYQFTGTNATPTPGGAAAVTATHWQPWIVPPGALTSR